MEGEALTHGSPGKSYFSFHHDTHQDIVFVCLLSFSSSQFPEAGSLTSSVFSTTFTGKKKKIHMHLQTMWGDSLLYNGRFFSNALDRYKSFEVQIK